MELAETDRLRRESVAAIARTLRHVFRPMDRQEARETFHLPQDKQLLLFGCQRITDERKGFHLLVEALQYIKEQHADQASNIELVVVGGEVESVQNQVPFNTIPVRYVSDPQKMVQLVQCCRYLCDAIPARQSAQHHHGGIGMWHPLCGLQGGRYSGDDRPSREWLCGTIQGCGRLCQRHPMDALCRP